MSDADPTNAEKPDLVIGSYRLLEPLGSGGMSSVFRAVHTESGHVVAVKVLPRSLAKNPTMLQRFLREAQSAESLEHPNIVAIYDRGVDQGRNYLVLEFVEGGDLHDRVRNEGPMGIADAVAVVKSVADGLHYAAGLGLIHRDIKPANLLLSPEGRVKIIDLGLALKSEAEDERVTRDGTTVGTVDYMAPEQARDSRATSERSDIYSLGCTLYYLLTGSPPFPGGDIADKLGRHCTKPAPDPCALRPEIPRTLGLLVRKMMAKRPENRFKDYRELLGALAAIPVPDSSESVDAVIDEDEDGGIPLAPIESAASGSLLSGNGHGGDHMMPHTSGFSLAELAEDDGSRPPPRPQAPSTLSPRMSKHHDDDLEPLLDDDEGGEMAAGDDEDELVEDLAAGRMAPDPQAAGKPKNLLMIYAGIGGVLGLILLIVVINMMIPHKKPLLPPKVSDVPIEAPIEPEQPVFVPQPKPQGPAVAPQPTPAPVLAGNTGPGVPPSLGPGVPPPVGPDATGPKPPTTSPAPVSTTWGEPADTVVEPPAEPVFAPEVEAKFPLPAWAKTAIPQRLTGNLLKVRRIVDPANNQERSSLSAAFDMLGADATEVLDDGPFIEGDLRIHGDAQLVRGAQGRRPIIRLDRPKSDSVKDQTSLFVLEGKKLILDGVDLIVDLQDLPRKHNALFACKGGSLTLHRCTITVHNPQNQPFSLIRVQGGDGPSQIRVEESLLRGSSISLVEITGGGAEVAVVRSVLLGGQAPLIVSTGTLAGGERRLHVQRSILAGRGPIVEISADNGKPAPVSVRSLGSTFARFRTESLVSLISFHDLGGEVKDIVNWLGEHNVFVGWNDWASMTGVAHTVKMPSLAAARTAWPSTDASSQEIANPWFDPPDAGRVVPDQLRSLAPQALPTLLRVAAPSPDLWAKTIEEFKRPEPPTFDSPIAALKLDEQGNVNLVEPAFNPIGGGGMQFGVFNGQGGGPGAPGQPGAPGAPGAAADPNAPAPPAAVKELSFDVTAMPHRGDLGRFLQEQIKPGDVRVQVRVTGNGLILGFTPLRVPDGTSLEIIVENSRVRVPNPPVWRPVNVLKAEALIEVKGGELVLNGVEFLRDATKNPKYFLRVEDGHLVLNRCRLTYPPNHRINEPGTGNLIAFRAPGSRPLTNRSWPFSSPIDKPVCRIIDSVLITPSDVLSAEVGRGMIALTECMVEAGGTIFTLNPAKVARNRFEADLWIERCTLAAEKSFVLLGPWEGSTPGPDRPWLVSSRSSAYMGSYTPISRESVLLRVEPNSLSQGTLFWQGYNDAYEVVNFTARNDKPIVTNAYPDVFRQWANFWGSNHFRNSTGPTKGTKATVMLIEKLKPNSTVANVMPADLALDPDTHPGRGTLDVGADVRVLQVTPPRPTRRRP